MKKKIEVSKFEADSEFTKSIFFEKLYKLRNVKCENHKGHNLYDMLIINVENKVFKIDWKNYEDFCCEEFEDRSLISIRDILSNP